MASGKGNNELYKALVLNKSGTNLGMIFENAVAQMLVANGHDLHYHEFLYKPDGGKDERPYEIDFLLLRGKRVCPIEVKSSNYKAHKSLDYFKEKYGMKVPEQYVLYTKDLSRDNETLYLPVYMAMCL